MNVCRLAALGIMACASAASLAACSAGLTTVSPVAASSAPKFAATVTKHTATGGVAQSSGGSPIAGAGSAGEAGAPTSGRGAVNFQMMTTSATARTIPVIAWGLFTAAGTDHLSKGGVVHTLVFQGGSFQLRYRLPSAIGFSGSGSTCLFTGSGNGTYTLAGGTGKYKRISGSGHYTLHIVEILAKVDGACSPSRPPVAFQEVIAASGTASLP